MKFIEIFFLSMGLSVLFMIFFFIILFILNKKTDKTLKLNYYSKIKIDTNKKIVYINPVRKDSNFKKEVYSLDDFIYMISITPDSKDLRELFKLIINERSKSVIEEKMKTLEDVILFTFERDEEKKSYAMFFSNSSTKNFDNLYFEMTETFISSKDKEIKIFKNEFLLLSDEKIFNSLHKDIKKISGTNNKHWVIAKISYKYDITPTQKSRKSRILESNKIKIILESNGINSYISKDFSVIASFPSTKVSHGSFTQKRFNSYVNLLLNPTKDSRTIINSKKFIISTIYDGNPSAVSLNFNLIKLQIISNLMLENKYDEKNSSNIFEEVKVISDISNNFSQSLKKNNNIIEYSEVKILEKGKIFNEYFLNMNKDVKNKVLLFSWKNKINTINEIINYVNNQSKKFAKRYLYFSFEVSMLNDVIDALEGIKIKSNFLIEIIDDKNLYDKVFIKEKIDILDKLGVKVMFKFDSIDGDDLERLIFFKPELILFSKNFKSNLGNEKIAINSFRTLMKNKSKDTKIFTIK